LHCDLYVKSRFVYLREFFYLKIWWENSITN